MRRFAGALMTFLVAIGLLFSGSWLLDYASEHSYAWWAMAVGILGGVNLLMGLLTEAGAICCLIGDE